MPGEYFQKKGLRQVIASNQDVALHGENSLAWVQSGHLDVFVSRVDTQGKPVGRLHHVVSFTDDDLFFFNTNLLGQTGLLAKAAEETVIFTLPMEDAHIPATVTGPLLDTWGNSIGRFMAPQINTRADLYLHRDTEKVDLFAEKSLRLTTTSHTLLWMAPPDDIIEFCIPDHFAVDHAAAFPVLLCHSFVLQCTCASEQTAVLFTSTELIEKYGLSRTLDAVSSFCTDHCYKRLERLDHDISRFAAYQRERDTRKWRKSIGYLARLLDPQFDDTESISVDNDPLLTSLERIGKGLGIDFVPPEILEYQSDEPPLALICKANNLRFHEVKLRDRWYESETMPMLGYTKSDEQPVAFMPYGNKHMKVYFSDNPHPQVINAKNCDQFVDRAFIFFKPLPDFRLSLKKVFNLAWTECRREAKIIWISGFLAAIIGLLTPIITSEVMNEVIPSNDLGYLYQIALGLVTAAVASTIFELLKAVAMMRGNFKGEAAVQPAVWDRLLKLPLTFFRQYSAGDLANRANSVIEVTNQLKGTIVTTALGGIFASVNFLVMFHFDAKLAFCGLGLAVLAAVVIGLLAWKQYRTSTRLFDMQGRISGMVLQFTTGISKLKSAGAEWRAYERWSRLFSEQKQLDYQAKRYSAYQETFSKFFDPVSKMVIIALLLYHWEGLLDGGQYAAFTAAMGMFISAILSTATVMQFLTSVALLFKRIDPIIEAVPEKSTVKIDPGILSGSIELSHASFRYGKDLPQVLKDVSLHADPGEFIAIVGNSGSGKSTVFRVLLGFEELESGEVFYDKMGLSQLDPDLVRKQIGVVLQNGNMLPGSIYDNIAGGTDLSVDDAWNAIRLAGLESDVKDMAMGIFTVISESARTFSGGQKQRLMIARALARNPKLLLFDEATSALDNTTQKLVASSIDSLNITRVIIAHRLSTVIHAHRIYVLENGHVTQVGTFQELMEQSGWFATQAQRQLL
ncbi:NHLP bacteriocin export ABC transporter permease/ATPase subunit [Desulfogranum japonicum]|uniref:NHLP bacteriocin export ABC transporter permease/ATPase subunit n=1 Tax=Desulfogranum japonicum TaxID=231447 RepID=UPI00041BB183|nr:NHLP bacteriocin export ABC transporter permease/ATPase subunit [Desulfogranum japonicum]